MRNLDPDILDPGIRDTVMFLRAHRFNTVDSCDGIPENAQHACARDLPFVAITVADPEALIREARRLTCLLEEHAIPICAVGPAGVFIQGSYDPGMHGNPSATCLVVQGLDDELLHAALEVKRLQADPRTDGPFIAAFAIVRAERDRLATRVWFPELVEDETDAEIARLRLAEIEAHPERLRHSTNEHGDCPHWCKACAQEAAAREAENAVAEVIGQVGTVEDRLAEAVTRGILAAGDRTVGD